jgi:molybdate transport system substrate-binding protein
LLLRQIMVLLLLVVLPWGCSCSPAVPELSVFAAAGAKPAVDEVSQKFQEQYRCKVEVSYGGGGEVLSQMILARTGDVYIAPEQSFMEAAVAKGTVELETIRSVAYMIPVIAVPKGNPKHINILADLAKPGIRVAVTRPETTLLGKYAPEIFQKAGLSEAISKNIVTQAPRPDSLLTMLVMGQVDAGIIWHFYQTLAPDEIETIPLSPEQLTGIGEMQIAVATYSQDEKSARMFINFTTSAEGKAVFKEYGYIVDSKEAMGYWQEEGE